MRARAIVGSTFASVAVLGAGWAAWALPATQQAQAVADTASSATPSSTSSTSAAASSSASNTPSASASASAKASASASASASSSASTGASGSYTGTAISMRYGTVQVSVTIQNGTLTEITLLQAPSGGKDAQYTNRAVPVLRQEALAAQSANISVVSGATYTSEAYIQSLQSALDQVG